MYFQQSWLILLQNFSPSDIWVSKDRGTNDHTPGKWCKFLQWPFFKNGLISYRTVLQNEIMIEQDFLKWSNQRFWGRRIQRVLNEENIPHILHHSGGKGLHFSIFYDIGGLERVTGWKQPRIALWNYILNLADVPKRLRGIEKPFDLTAVGFGDGSLGHLIREIGGKKRQVKRPITSIPKENIILTGEIKWPKKVPVWHVPVELLSKFRFRRVMTDGECNHCKADVPSHFIPIFLDDETQDYPFWIGCWHCKSFESSNKAQ